MTNLYRRVFARTTVNLMAKASPTFALFLRNAQTISGGLSPFTQPVQVGNYTSAQWAGAGGTFTLPQDSAQEANAEYNLYPLIAPVPYFGLESLIEKGAVAVTSRLELKLNDLKNANSTALSSAIFGSNLNNLATVMYGLQDAYDDGTTVASYASLNRSTYQGWKGTKVTSFGSALTRANTTPLLLQATKAANGEAPDFGILSIEDWTGLLTDFMTDERYQITPRGQWGKEDAINSGFRGLMLGNTPIFFDQNLAQGTAYFINSRYIGLGVHEDASFAWTGWEPTLAQGQLGYIGAQVTAANLICKKPSSGMIVTGITSSYTW
jgi:hypothetical protein